MTSRIVRIGNSQGVRIPKPLLDQAGLSGEVEMSVRDGSLIIRPVAKAREGWAASFREMARRGDDAPIVGDAPGSTAWDQDEWEW